MTEPIHLITVASWEDRFVKGLRRLVASDRPTTIQMYYFSEYKEWSTANREQAKAISADANAELTETALEIRGPAMTWKTIEDHVNSRGFQGSKVVIDISTMPRDVIWSLFFQLKKAGAIVSYAYHQPESYSKDWLSRDPGKPRLLFKMSGVSWFNRQTALVLTTGYDAERTLQLIRSFEPQRVALFIQAGKQFDNDLKNLETHKIRLREERPEYVLEIEEIDAFSADHGEAAIGTWVQTNSDACNIIMSSLGPKLSAVAMFRLQQHYRETALCYAPSNEFNPNYSTGIGPTITGLLDRI